MRWGLPRVGGSMPATILAEGSVLAFASDSACVAAVRNRRTLHLKLRNDRQGLLDGNKFRDSFILSGIGILFSFLFAKVT